MNNTNTPTATISMLELLSKKFPTNEYALMEEVRDKAGFDASSSADFIAVNLWPSRGLAVNGIEMKRSRGDWLSEIKKPAKAENIFQYCDYFWLLTADTQGIAKLEEIPETWGWIAVKGGKIVTMKEAPKLQPIPISRNFLCAMLKRANDKTNYVHVDKIADRINAAWEAGKESQAYQAKRDAEKLKELQQVINDFKKHSGIDLQSGRYACPNAEKIGKAVQFILDGGVEKIKEDLLRLEPTAKYIHERILKGTESIQSAKGELT